MKCWVLQSFSILLLVWQGSVVFAQTTTELPRIAHAGGQVDGATYTNSIEALEENYGIGFRAFEIDFSWTSDEQLVCLHDWEKSFERSFRRKPNSKVSLGEFETLVRRRSEFTKCTLASLMRWMSDHPDAILVTDVKERNLAALEHISQYYPQLISRVVPQIYQPDEYAAVKRAGYEKIIWTLYLFAGGTETVLETAQSMELWAVTIDTNRAGQGLGRELSQVGIPTYVHTINDYADFLFFKSEGVSEIYTDRLSQELELELVSEGDISIEDSELYQSREAKSQELRDRINRFYRNSEIHFSIEVDFVEANTITNHLTIQDSDPDKLQISVTGNDPYLIFPLLRDPQRELQVYIQLEVPDDTVVELFYTTRSQPEFVPELVVSERVVKGSNEIVFSLDESDRINRLRLDPGIIPGNYRIERLEVRSDCLLCLFR
jgi:glycerophosphoryl diester phosphodiesterase